MSSSFSSFRSPASAPPPQALTPVWWWLPRRRSSLVVAVEDLRSGIDGFFIRSVGESSLAFWCVDFLVPRRSFCAHSDPNISFFVHSVCCGVRVPRGAPTNPTPPVRGWFRVFLVLFFSAGDRSNDLGRRPPRGTNLLVPKPN